jgi:hypothetical protein
MAILKKKMAGKPAMMKRKAKDGDTVDKGETKTGEVKVRPSFGQNFKSSMKNFMTTDSTDYQNTPAKTKAGKILRGANKVASVAARVAGSPAATAASALGAGVKSVQNAVAKRKELKAIPEKKMGGKMKKYQAGGVVGKQPKAGMVDSKGAFTKVQKRTLAQKKK